MIVALIDEFADQTDVRRRQGSWGILSRDLGAMSFELALIAALAPFYNAAAYAGRQRRTHG